MDSDKAKAGNSDNAVLSPEPPPAKQRGNGRQRHPDWRKDLIRNKDGAPRAALANVVRALTYADEWRDLLAFNEFSFDVMNKHETPWGKPVDTAWTDTDDSRLTVWLQDHEGIIVPTKPLVVEAVQQVARNRPFHPVKEKVRKLKQEWDGNKRIETWLIDYLGAEDTPYTRAVGPRWLISLMARLFDPGCQADYVLLLEGDQGFRKSSALRALVGDEWFNDRLSDLGNKDSMIEVRGKWVIEMADLPNLRGAVLNRFKAFITSRSDYFREPYGTRATTHPRQCVLAATTNLDEPFIDPTGTRRMWPVRCGVVKLDLLTRDAGQLLGEACVGYDKGDKSWLELPELEALARAEQDDRYEPGVWDDIILNWLEAPEQRITREHSLSGMGYIEVPVSPWNGSSRDRATIDDILVHACGKDKDRLTQADRRQVQGCLKHERWEKQKQDRGGVTRGLRFYHRPQTVESKGTNGTTWNCDRELT